jgi:hypothetical protein
MEYMMTEDTNLPFYVDGVLAGPGVNTLLAGPNPRPPEEKPEPPPKSPPPDSPGTDHDNGDDDDDKDEVQSAANTPLPPLDPIFKPGRHRPEPRKGA